MVYSAYKLNQQGDNIQPWHTPLSIWNQSIVPCLVLTVASWPPYRFLRRNVKYNFMLIWYPCVLFSELSVISFTDIKIFLFCFLIAFILCVPHFHTCPWPLTLGRNSSSLWALLAWPQWDLSSLIYDTRAKARRDKGSSYSLPSLETAHKDGLIFNLPLRKDEQVQSHWCPRTTAGKGFYVCPLYLGPDRCQSWLTWTPCQPTHSMPSISAAGLKKICLSLRVIYLPSLGRHVSLN